jgi:catechol 2,3-dioxygenase-like lactoylglutathione lyase family enzyme
MLKKLDHINIVVSNLQKAKAFFIQLGFSVLDEAELEGEWISKVVGLEHVRARYVQLASPGTETNLELIEYSSPVSERDPEMSRANQIGLRHIAFEVEDIESVVQNLQAQGIQFFSPVQTYAKKGKKIVYFLGPDGILLELAQYGL